VLGRKAGLDQMDDLRGGQDGERRQQGDERIHTRHRAAQLRAWLQGVPHAQGPETFNHIAQERTCTVSFSNVAQATRKAAMAGGLTTRAPACRLKIIESAAMELAAWTVAAAGTS